MEIVLSRTTPTTKRFSLRGCESIALSRKKKKEVSAVLRESSPRKREQPKSPGLDKSLHCRRQKNVLSYGKRDEAPLWRCPNR
jgi:hypothetical protein